MAAPFASRLARLGSGPLVVAGALPFLFLHRHYQPNVSIGSADVDVSDLAVLAIVATAARQAVRGARPAGGRLLWSVWAAFLVWIACSLVYGRLLSSAYPFGTHAVTALKFGEYALLAPAVALLLRRAPLWPVFAVALGWSCFLTGIAALQFLGVLPEFDGLRPGQREPSYIGIHDLGAFSGTVFAFALVAVAFRPRERAWPSLAAGVAGGLGVGLAAALDSVGGLIVCGAIIVVLGAARHETTVLRATQVVVLVVAVGVLAVVLRASAIQSFLRFVGLEHKTTAETTQVQSYAHRTVLAYIGYRIWFDHPLLGVGWQGSGDPFAFRPELPAAHRRFPSEPAEAFPSRAHEWGVQTAIVQALADMGPIGLALFLAVFVVPLATALRRARRAGAELLRALLAASCALVLALAVFTGSGIVTGAPLDALLWLAFGLAASLTDEAATVS